MSALRTPCHARTIVRSAATGPTDEAQLDQMMALTQLALLILCVARVCADLVRGPLTFEGHIALAVVVVLAMLLIDRATEWVVRDAPPSDRRRSDFL